MESVHEDASLKQKTMSLPRKFGKKYTEFVSKTKQMLSSADDKNDPSYKNMSAKYLDEPPVIYPHSLDLVQNNPNYFLKSTPTEVQIVSPRPGNRPHFQQYEASSFQPLGSSANKGFGSISRLSTFSSMPRGKPNLYSSSQDNLLQGGVGPESKLYSDPLPPFMYSRPIYVNQSSSSSSESLEINRRMYLSLSTNDLSKIQNSESVREFSRDTHDNSLLSRRHSDSSPQVEEFIENTSRYCLPVDEKDYSVGDSLGLCMCGATGDLECNLNDKFSSAIHHSITSNSSFGSSVQSGHSKDQFPVKDPVYSASKIDPQRESSEMDRSFNPARRDSYKPPPPPRSSSLKNLSTIGQPSCATREEKSNSSTSELDCSSCTATNTEKYDDITALTNPSEPASVNQIENLGDSYTKISSFEPSRPKWSNDYFSARALNKSQSTENILSINSGNNIEENNDKSNWYSSYLESLKQLKKTSSRPHYSSQRSLDTKSDESFRDPSLSTHVASLSDGTNDSKQALVHLSAPAFGDGYTDSHRIVDEERSFPLSFDIRHTEACSTNTNNFQYDNIFHSDAHTNNMPGTVSSPVPMERTKFISRNDPERYSGKVPDWYLQQGRSAAREGKSLHDMTYPYDEYYDQHVRKSNKTVKIANDNPSWNEGIHCVRFVVFFYRSFA